MRSLYEKKTYMSIQNMKKIHNLGNIFGKYMKKSNIFYEKGVKKTGTPQLRTCKRF